MARLSIFTFLVATMMVTGGCGGASGSGGGDEKRQAKMELLLEMVRTKRAREASSKRRAVRQHS